MRKCHFSVFNRRKERKTTPSDFVFATALIKQKEPYADYHLWFFAQILCRFFACFFSVFNSLSKITEWKCCHLAIECDRYHARSLSIGSAWMCAFFNWNASIQSFYRCLTTTCVINAFKFRFNFLGTSTNAYRCLLPFSKWCPNSVNANVNGRRFFFLSLSLFFSF